MQAVVVLMSVEDVQNRGPDFQFTHFVGPPFLVYVLSKIWDFLYDCICITMITQ